MDIHRIDFNWLKKQAKNHSSENNHPIKLALLSDSTTQLIAQAIIGYGSASAIDYTIYQPDYDHSVQEVFDTSSGLYSFQPDFVIILRGAEHLREKFYRTPAEKKATFARDYILDLDGICSRLEQDLAAKLIICNYPTIDDGVFGNYTSKVELSFPYQLRKLNYLLMETSARYSNRFIADLSALLSQKGYETNFDPKMYYNADQPFSLSFLPWLAKTLHDIIMAIHGRFKKCLVLDLDNTIWGGIIGDDGLNSIQIGDLGLGKIYTDFQLWIKALKDRGIILAVCSKNDPTTARLPFLQHPQMELRLEDIAVFVANWESKVDNIRHISETLQIGFDAMVFVDDDPVERARIRENIPGIAVPDLPSDPADYLLFLRDLNLFETASYTAEDKHRTILYQRETARTVSRQTFSGEAAFLESLEMHSTARAFDSFDIPRIAQLSQRSNQFNLRTIRYTEQEVTAIAANPGYLTVSLTLEDNYGDYGLVAFVILHALPEAPHALFIESWVMSCRVLKRSMEQFTLNYIIQKAREAGYTILIGEYLPTVKNELVRDHYAALGFRDIRTHRWELDLTQSLNARTFIKPKY